MIGVCHGARTGCCDRARRRGTEGPRDAGSAPQSSHGAARRARIVLLAAEGLTNLAIAEKLDVSRRTVGQWRRRFAERRLDGLDDEPRPGAPRKIGDDKITVAVTRTLETMPAEATHWSRRSMARASGISATSAHRIWQAFALQPHRRWSRGEARWLGPYGHHSVSSPRSSNRTCGFPASGFPTGFTSKHTAVGQDGPDFVGSFPAFQFTELPEHDRIGETWCHATTPYGA